MFQLLGIIFLLSTSTNSAAFYVSPSGNDITGDGSISNPWQSVPAARDAVRSILATGFSEDVTVYLSAGEYELDAALDFDIRDSAPAGNTITYASKDGVGTAVLKSRSVITNSAGWFYFTNGIWKIAVGTGHDIDTLYEGDLRAVEARYPNVDANRLYPQARTPYLASVTGEVSSVNSNISWITYTEGDFESVPVTAASHITISPWARSNWHLWTCEITGTDTNLNRIDFDNMGDQTPIGEFARYFLSGALDYLDAGGEFYYDSAGGDLYYKPRTMGNPAYKNISVPALKTLVNIAGSNKTSVVRGLKFDGLVFSDTAAIVPALQWWNLDWGKEDHAIIKMQNTSDVRLNKCRIKNSGRHGILVIGQNEAVRIESCLIENTGVSGIVLCNRYSKTPDLLKNCVISNCVVQNVGNLSYDAGCIELMSTESCLVDRCGLYDSSRYGVSLRGNCTTNATFSSFAKSSSNIVRNSRIERCMQDSGDGAALHQAGINPLNGPNTNYFENIYIYNTYSVAGQNDPQQVKGVYMDWPLATQNQSFKNIQVDVCEAADVVFHGNPSQLIDNVSWMPGFDTNRMDFSKMQLSADFPPEFGFPRTASPVFRDIVIDNNDPEFTEYGTSWGDSNLGRRKTFWDRTDAPNSRLYKKTGANGHSAVWRPDIKYAGYYDVYVWKFQTNEQSTTGVVYSVGSSDGTNDITVNQRMPQLVWERLGTHYFERGASGYVRLDADTAAMDAAVRADAVRFTAVEPKEKILWEEDFESGYIPGTVLTNQNGWITWVTNSPSVQSSNDVAGFFVQGINECVSRARRSVSIASDQFVTIQFTVSIPSTSGTSVSQNHVGLGNLALNSVGVNAGINATGIFFCPDGIGLSNFVYGYINGQRFVPEPAKMYTIKAVLNLLEGTARLFVAADGLNFTQLSFDADATVRESPFSKTQISNWNSVYIRMGQHTENRIYDLSVMN